MLEEMRRGTVKLREALESEYREVLFHGKRVTPAVAARHVKKGYAQSIWLPGPIVAGAPLPLSPEECSALYATNVTFDVAEERDASYLLPEIDGLMTLTQFRTVVADIESLVTSDLAFKTELWDSAVQVGSEQLGKLLVDIGNEFSEHYRKLAWRPHAIVAGIRGGSQRAVWEVLAAKVMEASELSAQHALSLHHRPKLSSEFSLIKQCETFDQLPPLCSGDELNHAKLPTSAKMVQNLLKCLALLD